VASKHFSNAYDQTLMVGYARRRIRL
jgi:hypothetical protein